MSDSNSAGGCGCGFIGSLFAVALSWTTFKSIGFAIVAAFFSWFYVIYYFVRYGADAFWRLF